MDKRSATVSARVTPELEAQVQAIALAREQTVSDLIHHALLELVERERLIYQRLSRAFTAPPDLSDLSRLPPAPRPPTTPASSDPA